MLSDSSSNSQQRKEDLSPEDVYRWLADLGAQKARPRQPDSKIVTSGPPVTEPVTDAPVRTPGYYCSFCGLHLKLHSTRMDVDTGGISHTCGLPPRWASTTPSIDVQALLRRQITPPPRSPHPGTSTRLSSASDRDLLTAADPTMTLAIQRLAAALKLSCVPSASAAQDDLAASPKFSGTRSDVEADLAPYALLASATSVVVRHLVLGGLKAMSSARSTVAQRPIPLKSSDGPNALLTPSHIIRGLLDSARQDDNDGLALCLMRLGYKVSRPV